MEVKTLSAPRGSRRNGAAPSPDMGVFAPPSPVFKNVQCVRETEILVEQQPPQGVSVCDHAGRVINEFSRALRRGQWGADSAKFLHTRTRVPIGCGGWATGASTAPRTSVEARSSPDPCSGCQEVCAPQTKRQCWRQLWRAARREFEGQAGGERQRSRWGEL